MKLPTKCRIGFADYKVRSMPPEEVDATLADGLCRVAIPELAVNINDATVHRPAQGVTLLHEIMHGIHDSYGMELGTLEERVVNTMSLGLAQVIKDNPRVIAWIIERLNS